MTHMLVAELRYNFMAIISWSAVLFVASLWPLLEARSLSGIPLALALMSGIMPIVAVIWSMSLLGVDKRERRRDLFAALPVTTTQVALVRSLRAFALSFAFAAFGVILAITGILFDGAEFTSKLAGAWALPALFLWSLAAAALATLVHDLLGSQGGQVLFGLLVAGLLIYLWSEPARTLLEPLVPLVDKAIQTPGGMLLAAASTVLFVLADIFLLRATQGRPLLGAN